MKVLKNILIGVSLLSATSLFAIGDCVVVDMINGDNYKFLFTENPVLDFEDGILNISAKTNLTLQVSEVEGISFPDTQNGINSIDNQSFTLSVEEGYIYIQEAEPNAKLLVMTVDCKLVKESTTGADGKATVSVPTQKGVYILTVGQKSIKFILK